MDEINMANSAAPTLLVLGGLALAVIVLFGSTLVSFGTNVFAEINAGIASFFKELGIGTGVLNNTSPTPTPGGSASPTPNPTNRPVYQVTFTIGGNGAIVWTDSTSTTGGTVDKALYPLGSATFSFNGGDRLSIQAIGSAGSPYEQGQIFQDFVVTGPSGGTSTTNPFTVTVENSFAITAYFSTATS